ncbi:trafficking protein particle complex subunit 8 [Condylostylus longicornis]|uniref:trafficking protein particle complex subunit 8 n=1 Tax=Condylostylus longicornis TaxID=2530218 RepID=UPI00244DC62F|nr:trafficking protein particle complex subunit 8 [Condylostylus longicornis]
MIHITGQNLSTREIIQYVFSPLVGAITSPYADELCQRNNLSFVELLQPFAKLANDAHFRDTSGTSVSIKGLRLNICDIGWRPPQTTLARKMLNEAVTNAAFEKSKVSQIGLMNVEIPQSEPWFENWREAFLTVQFPADHEFTRHFLSCLIVLSGSDPNILDTANQLTKKVQMLQNITPQKLPKWFQNNDVLNSYVLLHDLSQGDISKAQQTYEILKSTFGDNKCFLVAINSLTEPSSEAVDPWTNYLKRAPKSDNLSDQGSAPKTPQDNTVSAMPSVTIEGNNESEGFLHPLSPIQEQATEAIHSKFSNSSESINSQTLNPNVWASESDYDAPHGMYLGPTDIENLKHFVQDYTVRGLIPYVERIVGTLNEAITNKKGVSKSLLSATKRLFATSKPVAGSGSQNAVIYTNESCELQTRKLGDLYFMFGHYNLAFQAYHQAKRDFNADSAWQYFAGALEMAALSAFMLGTANRKTYDYMESAIECYLTSCRLQQFATRATLLSVECLKNAKLYGEAAKQLIRMTSEESDLRSALLLEQASYCFLASQPPMYRKYAFHIVLSGNRFSRCGQRKHAFRCYKQAYQIFQDRGWSLAEDHIQYTIGKQAVTLKKLDVASKSLAHLLRPLSLQNVAQQAAFLREYIATQKELINQNNGVGLLEIALPKVNQASLRVLVTSHPPVTNPLYISATNVNINSNLKNEAIWQKLEEIVVTHVSAKPMVFKPAKCLFTSENLTTDKPLSVHGDPIEISVCVQNTIKPSITFSDINLLWKFSLENNAEVTNKVFFEGKCTEREKEIINSSMVTTDSQQIVLNESEEKILKFKLTPKLIGELRIIGIAGRMASTNEAGQLLGSILFEPQPIKVTEKFSANVERPVLFDNKLNIEILPPAPSLHVSFSKIPTDVVVGEIMPITICLRNSGMLPIESIYLCTEQPRCITFLNDHVGLPLSVLKDYKDLTNEALSKDKEMRKQHVFKIPQIASNTLKSEETKTIQMWIQAPYIIGEHKLRLLVYYSMPKDYPKIRYRLVRHEWDINVFECLQAEVTTVVGNLMTNELGLDVHLKNMNQEHHPLMTEVYINSIEMYCPKYKLNTDRILYTNEMEIVNGQLNEKCLKPSKSVSFRCKLMENPAAKKVKSEIEYIKTRLSALPVTPNLNHHLQIIPSFEKIYSFLMKHETRYLNVYNAAISTEEFNSMIATYDPHMTIAITWTAIITEASSSQRSAYGQHFIPLRNLYEQVSCPETADYRIKTYLGDHSYHKIYEFEGMNEIDNDFDDDQWEPNKTIFGKRCLLEDESMLLNTKGQIENTKVF